MQKQCREAEASIAHVMKHAVPAWGLLNASPEQHHDPRDLERHYANFQHIITCITSAGASDQFADKLELFSRAASAASKR